MKNSENDQSVSMAELFDAAVAATIPDSLPGLDAGVSAGRSPLDRWDIKQNEKTLSAATNWTPGLQRANHDGYVPLLWLGRGASAEVWRCVDRSFGREFAIKSPAVDTGQSHAAAIKALQDEAELLGTLQHPGIVHAVRFVADDQASYLALDFVDGDDILQHCKLTDANASARHDLLVKVVEAVAYLHAKDVVHGDLKPEHILVREDNQPVLIDFGLSSLGAEAGLSLGDPKRIGGSGIYRAPEVSSGTAVSPEPTQDVYSLGVIFREIGADLFPEVIDRATRENSGERWPDATAMLDALRQSVADSNADSRDKPVITPTQARPSKQRQWLALAAILLIAMTAFIAVVYSQPDQNVAAEENNSSNKSDERAAATASAIEALLGNIYAGDRTTTLKEFNTMIQQDPNLSDTWEMRHLDSMLQGDGEDFPIGATPYGTKHAICSDFDPATNTLAYVEMNNGRHELWVRSYDFDPRKIGESVELIRAVAISPGAKQVASVAFAGHVKLWSIDNAAGDVLEEISLPKQPDAKIVWFGPDANRLFFFSPKTRTIECWAIDEPAPTEPVYTLSDCDHAYLLPSGEGAFLVATLDEQANDGFTKLRMIEPGSGKVIRDHELTIDQLPASADAGIDEDSVLCLGMPDGYVWIHSPDHGGWQMHCDLGHNGVVTSVLSNDENERVFASQGRVHVIDLQGNLLTRLGDRNEHYELVTELSFEDDEDTLTVISTDGIRRCFAK
ncbi:MAG: WD40 repeat domain-containing serine/threonine protein kinase [Planctomycetota bacterium]